MTALRSRAVQHHPHRAERPTLLFGDARLSAALRRENQFNRGARRSLQIVALLASFTIGVSVGAKRAPEATPAPAPKPGLLYQKAQRLAAGKMSCSLDPHEGCLVCLHRDVEGQAFVASHC